MLLVNSTKPILYSLLRLRIKDLVVSKVHADVKKFHIAGSERVRTTKDHLFCGTTSDSSTNADENHLVELTALHSFLASFAELFDTYRALAHPRNAPLVSLE